MAYLPTTIFLFGLCLIMLLDIAKNEIIDSIREAAKTKLLDTE